MTLPTVARGEHLQTELTDYSTAPPAEAYADFGSHHHQRSYNDEELDVVSGDSGSMCVQASSRQDIPESKNGHEPSSKDKYFDALTRSLQSITTVGSLEEMLRSVIDEVVSALEAQRGAILLENDQTKELDLKAVSRSRRGLGSGPSYSRTVVQRAFRRREALLCTDIRLQKDLEDVESVTTGAMLSVIAVPVCTVRRCLGVIHIDRGISQEPFCEEELRLAKALAAGVAGAIESTSLVDQQRHQFLQMIQMLSRAIEMRNLYTSSHTERVTEYSLLIAHQLDFPEKDYNELSMAAMLHDVGKIGVDDAILRKPGPLTAEEFVQMKLHAEMGGEILEAIPGFQKLVGVAKYHHERWDGRGYPHGLAGEEIPLSARIVAVADAFDAMTSDRPYRKAFPAEQAFAEIQAQAGAQFDPRCVEAFLKVRETVERICQPGNNAPLLIPGSVPEPSVPGTGVPETHSDHLDQTIKASLDRENVTEQRQACLIHIYPTGPVMGTRYPLSTKPLIIGRSESCDVAVEDHAVSRRHVRIQPSPTGFQAVDLESTNGTLVNNVMAPVHDLQDGDYLRIGSCIYRFLEGGNLENEYHEEIYRLTIVDGLTNIYNKRYFLECLELELNRSVRYSRPLSLIMFDVDHFKQVNDDLGHLAGDTILREMAASVKTILEREQTLARYGGEEFAIILPETTLDTALELAEKVRARIEQHPFAYQKNSCPITISLGVSCAQGNPDLHVDRFVQEADSRLYEAKRSGRNCVKG